MQSLKKVLILLTQLFPPPGLGVCMPATILEKVGQKIRVEFCDGQRYIKSFLIKPTIIPPIPFLVHWWYLLSVSGSALSISKRPSSSLQPAHCHRLRPLRFCSSHRQFPRHHIPSPPSPLSPTTHSSSSSSSSSLQQAQTHRLRTTVLATCTRISQNLLVWLVDVSYLF